MILGRHVLTKLRTGKHSADLTNDLNTTDDNTDFLRASPCQLS
jgi:hypothetical protein